MSGQRSLVNRLASPDDVPAPAGAEVTAFHAELPGYAPTPLRDLPAEAEALGLASLRYKDESDRFGLPAFKILGASWAIELVLREQPGVRTLIAASEGNHGRAVARAARMRGLASRIFLPDHTSADRARLIAEEGAEVIRVRGTYEQAVATADADAAVSGGVVIADVAYEADARVPAWVTDGYSTSFREAAAQARHPFDLVFTQIGVGSFAAAGIRFALHQSPRGHAVGVEPETAACALASLAAGQPVVIETPGTSMAGLNCGTPSAVAWPTLRDGLTGCIAISDAEARTAMCDLAALGLTIGDCGASPLAALRALATDDRCAKLRDAVGLSSATRVLLVATEGASDPAAYAAAISAEE